VTLVLIGFGGAAGAVARFLVDNAVLDRFEGAFPLGIFVVNLTGAFALGLLAGLIVDRGALPSELRNPLMVGFLGAYTTFSTLMLDSFRLFEDGLPALALVNIAGSTVLGVIAVVGGLWLGRALG
jgi:fluoride exporter